MSLTIENLKEYLHANGNRITTAFGLKIGLSKWGIHSHSIFPEMIPDFIAEEGYFEMSILTEGDSEWDFIQGFKLESLQQIDQLSYQHSWMRYLNGEAEIILNLIEFDFELRFRIYKYKTMVYCPEIHFYDEVHDHLTLREDFENYVNKHKDFLQDSFYRQS